MERFNFKKRGMELEEKTKRVALHMLGDIVKTSDGLGKLEPEKVILYNEVVDYVREATGMINELLEHYDALEEEIIQANEDRRKMLRLLEELKEQTK